MKVQGLRHAPSGRKTLVSAETDLLIEGFPRSANGWSIRVFDHWQEGTARIARHEHSEAHVVAGCRLGKPVLVLLREPGDAIRSFLQRDPDIAPDWALRRWTRFYTVVEQVADDVVIATFEQTTGDFGRVVQRLNARYGTTFHHGTTDEALFRQVTGAMSKSSMPDSERRKGLAKISVDLDPRRLAVARSLYERLAAMALAADAAR